MGRILPKQRLITGGVFGQVQGDPTDTHRPEKFGGGIDGLETAVAAALHLDQVIDPFDRPAQDMELTITIFDNEGVQDRPGVHQRLQRGFRNAFGFSTHYWAPKIDSWAS